MHYSSHSWKAGILVNSGVQKIIENLSKGVLISIKYKGESTLHWSVQRLVISFSDVTCLLKIPIYATVASLVRKCKKIY